MQYPHKVPLDDKFIAQLLDLEDLAIVSYRYLRNKLGKPIACINLASIWILDIGPALLPSGLLGVAVAHTEEVAELRPVNWVKAFLATGDDFTVKSIECDPLGPDLQLPPLLTLFDGCEGRDGICYRLRTNNGWTETSIVFYNPFGREWNAIESKCLSLADEIAAESGNANLLKFIADWRRYVD